jgi:flagellin
MSLNSVNTNIGAMVALQSLNRTNQELESVQKRISTGFRVADAKDDGAAFAVAQRIRGDIAGLTTANEQLNSAKGLLNTTMGALREVSELLVGKDGQGGIKSTLTKLSSTTLSASDRRIYTDDFVRAVNQMNRSLGDASYNGQSLIASQDSQASATVTVANANANITRNEAGSTLLITAVDATTLTFDERVATRGRDNAGTWLAPPAGFDIEAGAVLTAAQAQAMLGNGPTTELAGLVNAKADNADFGGNAAAAAIKSFDTVLNAVNNALAKFGADSRGIDVALSTNRTKINSFESGLGALVDADLAKESARLQALQIRQQLGTQSLSIANQSPQSLLSLFR